MPRHECPGGHFTGGGGVGGGGGAYDNGCTYVKTN